MKNISEIKSWQEDALAVGCPAQYFLIQAPGGAGKSLLQVMLAQADIEETGNKQLLLVPKNHIHYGFFDETAIEFLLPGKTTSSLWQVKSNFCSNHSSTSKVAGLKKFLLADNADLAAKGELAAIATHQAMVRAWAMLSESERAIAVRNISFRIDEAHHLSHVFDESELERFGEHGRAGVIDQATSLGRFAQDVLCRNIPSVKMHLATATFYRGDRRTILSDSYRKKFAEYCLPWDEYFDSLGIKHLEFNFITYEADPIDSVVEACGFEPNHNHLIILPPMKTRFRNAETLSRLIKQLTETFSPNEVLDLVTPETQEKNKAILNSNPDNFRVVVACRLFDEGTDWVPCNRMHNTDACESSLTLAIQRIFRPLRKHPSKDNVQINNYIPSFLHSMKDEDKRRVLSNRFTSFIAVMIVQDELEPATIRLRKNITKEEEGELDEGETETLTLASTFGDAYIPVMEALLKEYELMPDKNDAKAAAEAVDRVMAQFPIPPSVDPSELKDELLKKLLMIAKPRSVEVNKTSLIFEGIDAEEYRLLGFDQVWKKENHPSSALCMGTENINSATIRDFLAVSRKVPTLNEIKEGIKKFHKRTNIRPKRDKQLIAELNRTGRSVDRMLKDHYNLRLSPLVKEVLGDEGRTHVARILEVIRIYWEKKIRLTHGFGFIPELGMTAAQANMKLRHFGNTRLAVEVDKAVKARSRLKSSQLNIESVETVVRSYLKDGKLIQTTKGEIPELGVTSSTLNYRIQRMANMSLPKFVDMIRNEMLKTSP